MSRAPPAEKGLKCPLWKKDVSKVCHTCPWYVMVRGTNPNTGKEIDDWACSLTWLPVLSVEQSQKTNSVGAAIEDFRNVVAKQGDIALSNIRGRLAKDMLSIERAGDKP